MIGFWIDFLRTGVIYYLFSQVLKIFRTVMKIEAWEGKKGETWVCKKKHHWVIESRVRGPTNSQTYKVIGHLDKLDNLLKSAIDIYYLFKSRKKLLKSAAENIYHKMSVQEQPPRDVLRKYAVNLQENKHAEVWFQKSCLATLLKSHFGMGVLL